MKSSALRNHPTLTGVKLHEWAMTAEVCRVLTEREVRCNFRRFEKCMLQAFMCTIKCKYRRSEL